MALEMQKISVLDCTLRDGAHVNSGMFGKTCIANIIKNLNESCIDIIEIGFLKNVTYNEDVTSYPCIEDACKVLSQSGANSNSMYAVMARADSYDINKLAECTGVIKLIRIAFYYDYLDKAIEFAKKVKEKGYLFTLNLINTPGNTLEEIDRLIVYANKIKPFAVMIVDTFGVLDTQRLEEIANNYNTKLDAEIKLGLHVHENMSSALSLAQSFIHLVGNSRELIIDGSLRGIGRAPGNLCIELLCNHLNSDCEKNYNLSPILDTISTCIDPIKINHKWGYSPEYFISAKYKVHRSYAEYLSERNINYMTIDRILSSIVPKYAEKFNEEYLLKLMKNFL